MRRWMLIAVISLFAAPLAFAQMDKGTAPKTNSPMACCQAMKQKPEMDAKLQSLVDDMNRAEGAAKIDKMAAVINELIAQRTMMQQQMTTHDSMADCPMMRKTSKTQTPAPHQH